MADAQQIVFEPDICFDACAACCEGGVEGDTAPVVVMGVAWYWIYAVS